MYKLYWSPRTGAFAPHAVLTEIGAPFELVVVDYDGKEQMSDAFKRLNPRAQIPVLALPGGTVMAESAAMVLYLADAHPHAKLMPPATDPARAEALHWLMFCLCNIYETDLRYYYAHRYTADPDGVPGVVAAAHAQSDASFRMLEDRVAANGGPYFLGARYSVLDPYIAMLVTWAPDPAGLLADAPGLERLCREVRNRPKLAPLFTENRMGELDRLAL